LKLQALRQSARAGRPSRVPDRGGARLRTRQKVWRQAQGRAPSRSGPYRARRSKKPAWARRSRLLQRTAVQVGMFRHTTSASMSRPHLTISPRSITGYSSIGWAAKSSYSSTYTTAMISRTATVRFCAIWQSDKRSFSKYFPLLTPFAWSPEWKVGQHKASTLRFLAGQAPQILETAGCPSGATRHYA